MKMKMVAIGAAAASLLTLGGGLAAYASIPDPSGVIHGCYKSDGSLSVIDPSRVSTCPRGQAPLNWNQTGPQGPQGSQGPQGPQ
jgi:hypothetical protein